MNFSDEPPALNPLPFIIADAVLLIAAFFIAIESPAPLATLPLAAITICVCLGAILGCIPIVLNYTRRADARLDERQAGLAALTQTAANAAGQLGVATANLHNIAEAAAKMLKHADALPARLQEKIAEFKIQLNEVNIAENETLEQEVATLRASETERLETAIESIKKTADEIISRETGIQKQSGDAARQLAHISAELKTAMDTLSAQIPAVIETSRRGLEESLAASIESRNKESLARLASELAAIENAIKERLSTWLAGQLAQKIPENPPPPEPPPAAPAHMQVQPKNTPKPDDTVTSNGGDDLPAANSEPPFKKTPKHPPASPRAQQKANPEKIISQPDPEPPQPETPKAAPAAAESPSADFPSSPFPLPPSAEGGPPPPKKRAPKPKPPRDDEPSLDLDLPPPSDEYSQSEPEDGGFTTAMSADGVTRLIVTAYIGIGNKLHIRGDGPGLSWDKGVPLQFVSIGKWRWETHDATAPISFKLYKNDSVECTRIGSPQLEPGHQHEVTANF